MYGVAISGYLASCMIESYLSCKAFIKLFDDIIPYHSTRTHVSLTSWGIDVFDMIYISMLLGDVICSKEVPPSI